MPISADTFRADEHVPSPQLVLTDRDVLHPRAMLEALPPTPRGEVGRCPVCRGLIGWRQRIDENGRAVFELSSEGELGGVPVLVPRPALEEVRDSRPEDPGWIHHLAVCSSCLAMSPRNERRLAIQRNSEKARRTALDDALAAARLAEELLEAEGYSWDIPAWVEEPPPPKVKEKLRREDRDVGWVVLVRKGRGKTLREWYEWSYAGEGERGQGRRASRLDARKALMAHARAQSSEGPATVLTELERRRVYYGCLGDGFSTTATIQDRRRLGREWLLQIGQWPDWSLALDSAGNVVGRLELAEPPPDPEGTAGPAMEPSIAQVLPPNYLEAS